jgi:uncharacterized protein DUF3551
VLAAGGLALLGAAPAAAFGTRYPFCMQGDDYPGLSNCTFTSYEQCQATASGRMMASIANPYYVGASDARLPGDRHLPGRTLPPTAIRATERLHVNISECKCSRHAITF